MDNREWKSEYERLERKMDYEKASIERKANESKPSWFFGGMVAGALSCALGIGIILSQDSVIIAETKPQQAICYDVNKDGLEDLIEPDGRVLIKQKDGKLIQLGELRDAEIKSVYEKYDSLVKSIKY
jgi:hypothetical protein